MTDYLILHKVRGEPAFDIAHRLRIGEDDGWIIPTSGHRAYPYRWWSLDNLVNVDDITSAGYHSRPATYDTIPANWPDHYSVNNTAPKASRAKADLLSELGLKGD